MTCVTCDNFNRPKICGVCQAQQYYERVKCLMCHEKIHGVIIHAKNKNLEAIIDASFCRSCFVNEQSTQKNWIETCKIVIDNEGWI